jgi:hypothetical protein
MTDLIKIEDDWFWSVVDRCWTANYDEYFNKPGKVKSRHPAEHT